MPKKSVQMRGRNFQKKVKEIVREELAVELENKVAVIGQSDVLIDTPFVDNGDVTASTNFVKLFPLISQGLGQYNERVGNEIRLKSLNIKMLMSYATSIDYRDLKDTSIGVRVMILRQKDSNSQLGTLEDFQGNKLLENGAVVAPGPAPFSGRTFNLLQKINREQFSVRYDKVFYLDAPWNNQNMGGTDPTKIYIYPPRPKVMEHTLRFGKHGLKLTYGDAVSENPTNFPYILCMGYASTVSSANPMNQLFTYSYTANADYTDA